MEKKQREVIITAQSRNTTTNPHQHGNITNIELLSFCFSVVFFSFSLSSSNREELSDDFKRHPFSFGDFKVHKGPRDATDDCIHSKHTSKSNGFKQYRETVSDDNVTYPERESTNGYADSTYSSWEDL